MQLSRSIGLCASFGGNLMAAAGVIRTDRKRLKGFKPKSGFMLRYPVIVLLLQAVVAARLLCHFGSIAQPASAE